MILQRRTVIAMYLSKATLLKLNVTNAVVKKIDSTFGFQAELFKVK